jgi:hypothetical protein
MHINRLFKNIIFFIVSGMIGLVVFFGCRNYGNKQLTNDDYKPEFHTPLANPFNGVQAGNPGGAYAVPSAADAEDVTSPDTVIGSGTPESCTAQAFIDAVAKGGKITFNTGGKQVVIKLNSPAKVFNDKPDIVIDGKGLVALSGCGRTRILYMNTCDPNQHWTTDHCQNQDHPRLTVQNLVFTDGNSTSERVNTGGGSIWVRGGRFKAVNCCFFNNACYSKGPDLGGGAIRVFSQYDNQPVYITKCTFGGSDGYGNFGSNGGAVSSIGVSWTFINCLFSYNYSTGNGGNPAADNTPGGGSGGAIYNDGNTMTLSVLGTLIENNRVNAFGAAIFFVTNDHTGNIIIDKSTIKKNTGGSWYPVYPGISMHDDTKCDVKDSLITN